MRNEEEKERCRQGFCNTRLDFSGQRLSFGKGPFDWQTCTEDVSILRASLNRQKKKFSSPSPVFNVECLTVVVVRAMRRGYWDPETVVSLEIDENGRAPTMHYVSQPTT
jgi:hypothetical protein